MQTEGRWAGAGRSPYGVQILPSPSTALLLPSGSTLGYRYVYNDYDETAIVSPGGSDTMRFGVEDEERYTIVGLSDETADALVLPQAQAASGDYFNDFTGNGGRIYPDGQRIERATPECASIDELAAYRNAGKRIIWLAIGRGLLAANLQNPAITTAHHFGRVVDRQGNSWAEHDNIGLSGQQLDALGLDTSRARFLRHYLGTRPVFAGARHADRSGWHFSQKRLSLHAESGRRFGNSLYSIPSYKRGTTTRFESRDPDRVWSDWSFKTRVTGLTGGLLLMASAYPVEQLLDDRLSDTDVSPGPGKPLNCFRIRADGRLDVHPQVIQGIDFQTRILDVLQEKAGQYDIDVPSECITACDGLREYFRVFKQVTSGEAGLRDLAHWTDWAAKAWLARTKHERQPVHQRQSATFVAGQIDKAFDFTTIDIANPRSLPRNRKFRIKLALGERMRLAGQFGVIDQAAEYRAMVRPPAGPASKRVELIRTQRERLSSMTWTVGIYRPSYGSEAVWFEDEAE